MCSPKGIHSGVDAPILTTIYHKPKIETYYIEILYSMILSPTVSVIYAAALHMVFRGPVQVTLSQLTC